MGAPCGVEDCSLQRNSRSNAHMFTDLRARLIIKESFDIRRLQQCALAGIDYREAEAA